RVVAHKVAALAQAEEERAKKLQQAEESAASFKAEVEKVLDWLKEDKERRDGVEKGLRDSIADLEKKLKDEQD
ncbi:hypothetical protein A2U01_0106555, partial [Trifolium medium]|nr:hypothetical protein [Trifolium medium]